MCGGKKVCVEEQSNGGRGRKIFSAEFSFLQNEEEDAQVFFKSLQHDNAHSMCVICKKNAYRVCLILNYNLYVG